MNLIMMAILLAVVTILVWVLAYSATTATVQCRPWVDLTTSSLGPGCVMSGG